MRKATPEEEADFHRRDAAHYAEIIEADQRRGKEQADRIAQLEESSRRYVEMTDKHVEHLISETERLERALEDEKSYTERLRNTIADGALFKEKLERERDEAIKAYQAEDALATNLERELAAARTALALPIHVLAHTLTQDELKLLGEQVALARAQGWDGNG